MNRSRERPDILWIVTTQWRGQALGIAEDPNVRTPNLDTLARRGVWFDQAVTPHPFGPFARAALLTGIPSPENGVRDYFDPLPTGTRTVADEMRDRGFATAWFGKWHLGPRDPGVPIVGQAHAKCIVSAEMRGGFEFWEGFEGGFLLNDPWLHGTRMPEPAPFQGYQSDVLCDRAGDWIRAEKKSPWFCVVSMESPHPPYDAPASGVQPGDPSQLKLRSNVPSDECVVEKARMELAGYYTHIEATDRAIGRLVDSVDHASTVVVITSVHGDMHGSHGLFRKGWPYEESIRVPLIIAQPGRKPGVDHSPVSLGNLSSFSLTLAEGREWNCANECASISMPSVVNLPHQCDRQWRGVRSADRKVVFNPDGSPWMVFNLRDDPEELENLAADERGEEIVRWAREIAQETDLM